jgi:tripartite-type tricarboxylate transporter receptor subunit TctC
MRLRVLAAVCVAMTSAASATEIPPTVVLKIGATSTSSLGTVGRIVANRLGKHLPGQPAVDAETVEGAFGVQLLRQLVETEPRDGSVVAMLLLNVVQRYVVDPTAYDFVPAELQWVGSLAKSVGFCVKDKDSDVSLADSGLKFGAASKTGIFYALPAILKQATKSDYDIVVGFKSENELVAALDRGEIDVYCGTSYSTFEREDRADTQTILGGFGSPEMLAELGVEDLGASFNHLDRKVLDLATVNYPYFYALALPPGTDSATVAAYRQAFAALNQDPAFLDEIRANVGEYAPTPGEEVQAGVERLLATDPDVVSRYGEIVK